MHTPPQILAVLRIAAAITMASLSAQGLRAQAFSAQITGSPTWQKGAATVTWSYTGNPPALVSQYGVKVVAVQMAGANTTYVLTPQTVSFSARQASLAANFTYTQSTTLLIVLEDTNGNKITPAYTVTFKPSAVTSAPAPTTAPNPALAAAACNYVFGQACTGSYAQFGTYLAAPGNAAMFPTLAAMQNYLINQVGTNPGIKTDLVTRAAGSQACTGAVNALTSAFTANPSNTQSGLWNSYAQLTPLASGVVRNQCATTAAPVSAGSSAQLTTALNTAFSKLALQSPTAAQTSALSRVTDPNAIASAVRSYIATDKTLQGQIVANTYKQVFNSTPATAAQTQLLAAYGSRWTAADDLATLLNLDRNAYAPAAPAAPASVTVKYFQLISGLGSRCLAVQNGSTALGTQLVLWGCDASKPEQRFTFMPDGSIRPFGNQYGNLCLDILDNARDGKTMVSGDHPQVWNCDGQQNQKFNFSNGTIQTPNGWCFDLWGGNALSFLSGAVNVQLYHCTAGADNQRFVAGMALPAGNSVSPIAPDTQVKILPKSAASIIGFNSSGVVSISGANIVAQGGGNIVAQGGGNIVAQGGGNIVAQGGGNLQSGGNDGMVIIPLAPGIVAQGGGNIVAQGGGN